jgi:methionine synthase II (cobalamin-independent)
MTVASGREFFMIPGPTTVPDELLAAMHRPAIDIYSGALVQLTTGVIDTLTNFVEHPEVVAERLEGVARAIGDPRRVLARTDCGFDTSAGMGRVAEDVVWAKLKALRDGARIASQRLF